MIRILAGWAFLLLGAAAGVALLPAGALAAIATPGPPAVRSAAALLVMMLLSVAAGCVRPVRRESVRLSNALLRTALPPVDPSVPTSWATRLRTGLWIVLHAGAGTAAITLSGMLLTVAVAVPVLWLDGDQHRLAYFGVALPIRAGWSGSWALPFAAAQVALAWLTGTAAVAGARRLAGVLLGPTAADRVIALQRQADLLAHRNRLARELHDSIGHTLNASVVQAAVAGRLVDTAPARARQAMLSIEEASRTALRDLDHMLGVLREEPVDPPPTRSLSDLPALLARSRDSGTDIRADILGPLHRVPPTVSREAYRIVQECLTNALRHAPASPVTLVLSVDEQRLSIRVHNPVPAGRATSDERGGRGLIGVAERVRLLGGEVTAGPTTDGNRNPCWQLAAWLPLPPR